MISFSNYDLEEARKEELQSWIENKEYIQVLDYGPLKISTRWIYTNKSSSSKQTCKANLVLQHKEWFSHRFMYSIGNDGS